MIVSTCNASSFSSLRMNLSILSMNAFYRLYDLFHRYTPFSYFSKIYNGFPSGPIKLVQIILCFLWRANGEHGLGMTKNGEFLAFFNRRNVGVNIVAQFLKSNNRV